VQPAKAMSVRFLRCHPRGVLSAGVSRDRNDLRGLGRRDRNAATAFKSYKR
jgi:hypothetical protein